MTDEHKKSIADFAMYTATTNRKLSSSDENLMDAIVYGVEAAISKIRKNKLAYVPERETLVKRLDQIYRQQRRALTDSGYGLTKCRRKAPCFSNGDIRRLLLLD